MLKNLFPSLLFHIIIFGILFVSVANYVEYKKTDAVYVDDELDEILSLGSDKINDSVKNFNIEEKISLYRKIKNNQIIEKAVKKNKTKKIKKDFTNNFNRGSFSPIYLIDETINDVSKENEIDNELKKILYENIMDNNVKNVEVTEIFSEDDIKNMLQIKKYKKRQIQLELSTKEKDNIKTQLSGCYKKAILKTQKDNKVKLVVNLTILENGVIDMDRVIFNEIDDKNKEIYESAINNVKIALVFCNPILNLPLLKYDVWKNITFTFDSNDVLY
ncbi:MAG: hypothetical protein LBC92_03520 [Rickettsiales bacterium]|jgi:hypothetical protein|nr:hypothetical protein [Rickettsiales bacterium]